MPEEKSNTGWIGARDDDIAGPPASTTWAEEQHWHESDLTATDCTSPEITLADAVASAVHVDNPSMAYGLRAADRVAVDVLESDNEPEGSPSRRDCQQAAHNSRLCITEASEHSNTRGAAAPPAGRLCG